MNAKFVNEAIDSTFKPMKKIYFIVYPYDTEFDEDGFCENMIIPENSYLLEGNKLTLLKILNNTPGLRISEEELNKDLEDVYWLEDILHKSTMKFYSGVIWDSPKLITYILKELNKDFKRHYNIEEVDYDYHEATSYLGNHVIQIWENQGVNES